MPPAYGSAVALPSTFSSVGGVYIQQLSDYALEAILERLDDATEGSVIAISHYMHGAVCRVKPDATAFDLRRPGAVHLRVNASWQDPLAADTCMAWTDETTRLLQSAYSGERIYANFQSIEGRHTAERLFGRNQSGSSQSRKNTMVQISSDEIRT